MLKWALSLTGLGEPETLPTTEATRALNKRLHDACATNWVVYKDSLKAGASILYRPHPTAESLFETLALNPNISTGMMILTVAFSQYINELAFRHVKKVNPNNKKRLMPIIEKRKQYQTLLETLGEEEQAFLKEPTNASSKITLAKYYLQAANYWMDLANIMLKEITPSSKSASPSSTQTFIYESLLHEMMFFARKAFRIAIYAEKGLSEAETQRTSLTHYYPNAPKEFQQYFDEKFRPQYLTFNLVAGADDGVTEAIAFASYPPEEIGTLELKSP